MKKLKNLIAVFLAVVMIFISFSTSTMFAFATSANNSASVTVQQAWAKPGTTVDVNIEI